MNQQYRILTLDGGGSKGFYTLGILSQLEETVLTSPLYKTFDLIYGTSTGAIIGSLIALGYRAKEIYQLYRQYVPDIMKPITPKNKSEALTHLAELFYKKHTLDDLKVEMGITAIAWKQKEPVIFRSHNSKLKNFDHFIGRFNPSLASAVVASCAAIPIFESVYIDDINGESTEIVDGGFFANNPSNFAVSDAINQGIDPKNISLLSIGTGEFPYPDRFSKARNLVPDIMGYSQFGAFFQNILQANTESVEPLIRSLYPQMQMLRINPFYAKPDVDFIEYDLEKLDLLFELGINAFETERDNLIKLFSA